METPLVASLRIELGYLVNTITHKIRIYVGGTPAGDATFLNRNDGNPLQSWHDAADELALLVGNLLPPTGVTQSALLQSRAGTLWIPIASYATSVSGSAGTVVLASQNTFVVRDTAFLKARWEVMETGIALPFHYPSGTTDNARLNAVTASFNGTAGRTSMLSAIMKSRGDNFLLASPVAGVTGDFNDKLRRRRGLT